MTTTTDIASSRASAFRQRLRDDGYHRVDVSMPDSLRPRIEAIGHVESVRYGELVAALAQLGLETYERGLQSKAVIADELSEGLKALQVVLSEGQPAQVTRLIPVLDAGPGQSFKNTGDLFSASASANASANVAAQAAVSSNATLIASSSLASFLRKRKTSP